MNFILILYRRTVSVIVKT